MQKKWAKIDSQPFDLRNQFPLMVFGWMEFLYIMLLKPQN
jgi:hypothetical protein